MTANLVSSAHQEFIANLAARAPKHHPPSVKEIVKFEPDGPYRTKSRADLTVHFALDGTLRDKFIRPEPEELGHLPVPLAGLRTSVVSGLCIDAVGGGEWHRARQEIITVLSGALKWTCEDLHGGVGEYELQPGQTIWLPPFILHSYRAMNQATSYLVLANTTFFNPEDHEDPRTHDTYDAKSFRVLQGHYSSPPG